MTTNTEIKQGAGELPQDEQKVELMRSGLALMVELKKVKNDHVKVLEEAYGALMWLHRRLPAAYKPLATIDQTIERIGSAIGYDAREFLAQRAASAPAEAVQAETITLTGHQLRIAADFINPDGLDERDQLDDDLTFGVRQHQDDDGKISTGMCCWNDDTDGVLPLDGEYEAATVPQDIGRDAALEEAAKLVDKETEWTKTVGGTLRYQALARAIRALASTPPANVAQAAPSTLAQQVASAQAETDAWPDGKLARVKLAGGDQP